MPRLVHADKAIQGKVEVFPVLLYVLITSDLSIGEIAPKRLDLKPSKIDAQ